MRIAINGLGRIGKNFLWCLLEDPQALKSITIAAINCGPVDIKYVATLFKYDSILGTFPGKVWLEGTILHINDVAIPLFTEINAELLPWKKLSIDWVVDCSGKYTHREKAQQHIKAGAHGVLISAPAHGDDVTIIPGVNESMFNKEKDTIVSLGSCTTNALMPLLKILYTECGLTTALMTTIHAYTNSQVLLDAGGDDLRRSRAAAVNIIPTTTGASESVAKVIPELANKVKGIAIRVPVDNVSLIDISFTTNKTVTKESINETLKHASNSNLKNIMGYTCEPLVSSDFKKNNHSVIVDSELTLVEKDLAKVFGWYDNEWGYSQRMKDFFTKILK